MNREVSYIEHLANEINKADGVKGAIEVIQTSNELLKNAQNRANNIVDGKQSKENQIPKDLVSQIRESMGEHHTIDTETMSQTLENAIKERLAEGKQISHAIIKDDGYEIHSDSEEELERD